MLGRGFVFSCILCGSQHRGSGRDACERGFQPGIQIAQQSIVFDNLRVAIGRINGGVKLGH